VISGSASETNNECQIKFELLHLSPALLFHSDARPAGSGAPAHRRAVSAADTDSAQRRGSNPSAARGNGAEVQGGIRHRLRLWLPKIVSGLAQMPRSAILALGCLTS